TKWLILNTPNNPTGSVYTKEILRTVADVLKKHPHVLIMVDEIYEHLVYDNTPYVSLLDVAPELADRTLLVNGVSKSYAMTGWRIGYGVGPRDLIKAINSLQSHTTTNACSISQYAALGALTGDQSFLKT